MIVYRQTFADYPSDVLCRMEICIKGAGACASSSAGLTGKAVTGVV